MSLLEKSVKRARPSALKDKRGAIAVEYAMILVMFVVPAITAIVAEGAVLYNHYVDARSWLVKPIP